MNVIVGIDRTLSGYKRQHCPSYTGLHCATLCFAIQPLRGDAHKYAGGADVGGGYVGDGDIGGGDIVSADAARRCRGVSLCLFQIGAALSGATGGGFGPPVRRETAAAQSISFSTNQAANGIVSTMLKIRRSAGVVSTRHWRPKAAASGTHSLLPIRNNEQNLSLDSVVKDSLTTAADGKQYRRGWNPASGNSVYWVCFLPDGQRRERFFVEKTRVFAPTGQDSIAQAEGLGERSTRDHQSPNGARPLPVTPRWGCGNVISPDSQAFSLGYRIRPRWGQEKSFTALPFGVKTNTSAVAISSRPVTTGECDTPATDLTFMTSLVASGAERGGRMSDLILYTSEDGQTRLQLRADGKTVWLTQLEIAELFQTTKHNISIHTKNIFKEGELAPEATVKESLTVQTEGGREVKRTITYYNLDLILAIGYRVRSPRGTQFRQWATANLREFIVKGFVMDDERLKNPGGWDYFDELLARIREIRASEKRFYQKVRDLFALSSDYKVREQDTHLFFAEVQNKLLYAATGHTAAELIVKRADPAKPNMALTNWSGSRVRKQDVIIAKNYLTQDEIDTLNRLVVIFLEQAELRVKQKKDLTLDFWRDTWTRC